MWVLYTSLDSNQLEKSKSEWFQTVWVRIRDLSLGPGCLLYSDSDSQHLAMLCQFLGRHSQVPQKLNATILPNLRLYILKQYCNYCTMLQVFLEYCSNNNWRIQKRKRWEVTTETGRSQSLRFLPQPNAVWKCPAEFASRSTLMIDVYMYRFDEALVSFRFRIRRKKLL